MLVHLQIYIQTGHVLGDNLLKTIVMPRNLERMRMYTFYCHSDLQEEFLDFRSCPTGASPTIPPPSSLIAMEALARQPVLDLWPRAGALRTRAMCLGPIIMLAFLVAAHTGMIAGSAPQR